MTSLLCLKKVKKGKQTYSCILSRTITLLRHYSCRKRKRPLLRHLLLLEAIAKWAYKSYLKSGELFSSILSGAFIKKDEIIFTSFPFLHEI